MRPLYRLLRAQKSGAWWHYRTVRLIDCREPTVPSSQMTRGSGMYGPGQTSLERELKTPTGRTVPALGSM